MGDTAQAERFYRDVLGLGSASRYAGASFYGSGGYHHELAGNIWNSRDAGKRPERMAGLDAVEILVRDSRDLAVIAARAECAGMARIKNTSDRILHDPRGNAIILKS